jgi:hypothetical protein
MLFAYSFSPVYLFFPFLLIFILGFEIAMFIDAWTNNGIARAARIWWLVGMILLQPFVAIVYFFTDRNKRIPR